jgi:5-methylcytosine-specific restriction endonuclease McrA
MSFNDNVRTQAYHRQNKRCGMCGNELEGDYECHHILRRADGGKDTLDNCVMLCHYCHTDGAHGGNFRNAFSLDLEELPYLNG